MTPIKNYSLKQHNTFGFDISADYFIETQNDEELYEALCWATANTVPVFPIGGGSNLLLSKPLNALVLRQSNAEISVISETAKNVVLHATAAVLWHDLVLYCVEHNYYGIENLSLIPGCVGAAPIQNIGAYGVELADVLLSVDLVEIANGLKSKLKRDKCHFAYRESVFKNELKGRYIITGITLQLSKNRHFNLSYAALKDAVDALTGDAPTLKMVSDSVCSIRNSKLPNPVELGNAGSFFKNPSIHEAQLKQAQFQWPEIPFHAQPDGSFKVPAAWMVERCGWKGYKFKGVGVHRLQSIVLVNYGSGTGNEILELATLIIEDVLKKFAIKLEIEPVTL